MAERIVLPVKSTSSTNIIVFPFTSKPIFDDFTSGTLEISDKSSLYKVISKTPDFNGVLLWRLKHSIIRFAINSPRLLMPTR